MTGALPTGVMWAAVDAIAAGCARNGDGLLNDRLGFVDDGLFLCGDPDLQRSLLIIFPGAFCFRKRSRRCALHGLCFDFCRFSGGIFRRFFHSRLFSAAGTEGERQDKCKSKKCNSAHNHKEPPAGKGNVSFRRARSPVKDGGAFQKKVRPRAVPRGRSGKIHFSAPIHSTTTLHASGFPAAICSS